VVSFMSLPLYRRENIPRCPLYRALGRPQNQSGRHGEEKNLLPLTGIKPRLLGCKSLSPDALVTELSTINQRCYYFSEVEFKKSTGKSRELDILKMISKQKLRVIRMVLSLILLSTSAHLTAIQVIKEFLASSRARVRRLESFPSTYFYLVKGLLTCSNPCKHNFKNLDLYNNRNVNTNNVGNLILVITVNYNF
jgi:hypothetical protein